MILELSGQGETLGELIFKCQTLGEVRLSHGDCVSERQSD